MGNEVYPHRLALFSKNICDVCKTNKGTKFHKLSFNPYIGMISCENNSCVNDINNSIKLNIKKIDELIKTYGEYICVIRSSGKKELNWIFSSDAYKEEKNGDFWVEVKHDTKNKTKVVKLNDIIDWNIDK